MLRKKLLATVIAAMFVVSSCSGDTSEADSTVAINAIGPSDCLTIVYAAVSPEKFSLYTELAKRFQSSQQSTDLGACTKIYPYSVSSGEAADLLKKDWPIADTIDPRPTIWSPASSSWVADVADAKSVRDPSFVSDSMPTAKSPVVLAMPERLATLMGWPNTPISMNDVADLCDKGWAKYGSAASVLGNFKLAKTNPRSSTTGRNTVLMQSYAAVNKTSGLTEEDVAAGADFSTKIENCAIHYGSTTGGVLERAYSLDKTDQTTQYISAVFVEETSVINYNRGNPTSRPLTEGEQLDPPKEKLVAIYPSGGSLESDNPFVVLSQQTASWNTPEQLKAGKAFQEYTQTADAQSIVGDYGFRSIIPGSTPSGLVSTDNKVDPLQPTTILETPAVSTAFAATVQWEADRKGSNVLFMIDTSGSMKNPVDNNSSTTLMQAAKDGLIGGLDHFRANDEVGIWGFTTGVVSKEGYQNISNVRDLSVLGGDKESLPEQINLLSPLGGTPLYDSIATGYDYVYERAEAGKINALLVLTDGKDEHSTKYDLAALGRKITPSEGADPTKQVRIFLIAYGGDTIPTELQDIATRSGGLVYDASEPRRINAAIKMAVDNF